MKVIKIFNNNCILAEEDGIETVITGGGVGFQKKPGDFVDITRIEKKYELIDEYRENFELLVKRVPFEFFTMTQEIVEYAIQQLNTQLDTRILISLTDHISFAVGRSREGIKMPTLFNQDIREFYPNEYRIGLWALELIKKNQDVELPEEEASFIALHILNAENTSGVTHIAQRIIDFVERSVEIIEDTLNIKLDRKSLIYNRTLTHLKFLGKRILENESLPYEKGDISFSEKVILRFSDSKSAVDALADFYQERYNYIISKDERLYLSIHIYQIISKAH